MALYGTGHGSGNYRLRFGLQRVATTRPFNHAAPQADSVVNALLFQEAANLSRTATRATVNYNLVWRFGKIIQFERYHVHGQDTGIWQNTTFNFCGRANVY